MFALVGAVLFDRGDQRMVVGRARTRRLQHPIERGIAAVLVIDVNRPEKVEIPGAQSADHPACIAENRR